MRRSTKVFAFMMAATLVASACGGDSDGSTGSIAAGDTATVDSASDSTDDGDRDRNVQVGGWGEDGSGFATVSVRDRIWTDVTTRVFRRARIELIDKRKLVNTRDVFVATMVARFESDKRKVFLKVAGFDTTGDDVTKYPIAGFGTDGVVTVDLSSDDPNRDLIPTAWTVVSRELVAVYFGNRADEPEDRGVVEYYNLATGEREKNLGIDGRTTIPMGVPIQLITDLGLRRVDDDGTLRLLLAGIVDYGENESSAAVFGFTPDGTFDPFVGDEGAGVLDFGGLIPAAGNFSRNDVRLTDPGVNGAPGIGVIVVSNDNDTVNEDNGIPATQLLTLIVVREDSTTKAVKMTNNGFFFRTLGLKLSNASIRGAALTPTGQLTAHISGSEAGTYSWETGETHYMLQISERQELVDVMYEPIWEAEEEVLLAHGEMNANVSREGRDFVVKSFKNMETDRFETRVCFAVTRCSDDGTTVSIDLIEEVPLDDYYGAISSMSVDESGVHAVVRFADNWSAAKAFKLVSVDPAGTGVGEVSPILDGSFETREIAQEEGEDWTYEVKRIAAPRPFGNGVVGALQYDRGRKSLRLQSVGNSVVDRDLSRPMGVDDYSGADDNFVVMNSQYVGMVAYVFRDDRTERRLYKVDVNNGSVDTSYGTDGYSSLPNFQLNEDDCVANIRLVSTAGTVTTIFSVYETVTIDGVQDCAQEPTKLQWQTFDVMGAPVGSGVSAASLVPDDRILSYASDGRGNLYYLTEQTDFADDGEYLGRTIRIKKLTAAGALDPTFATNGVLAIEGVDAPTQIALDDQGRLYVGMLVYNRFVQVSRYTTVGVLDVSIDVEPTPPTLAPNSQVTLPPQATVPPVERLARDRFVEERQKEELAALPPDDGLTVTVNKPLITSARPIADRSLNVTWAISAAAGSPYVTATAMPSGRSCTSNTDSCVIRGLDPSQKYTVTVALKGETAATAMSVTATPVVSMKIGRVASPTTFVRPASRGAATWKVRGGCTLNANNTRITAPQRATTCQLSVTTAKFGSTPKTTKSVTIVVKK